MSGEVSSVWCLVRYLVSSVWLTLFTLLGFFDYFIMKHLKKVNKREANELCSVLSFSYNYVFTVSSLVSLLFSPGVSSWVVSTSLLDPSFTEVSSELVSPSGVFLELVPPSGVSPRLLSSTISPLLFFSSSSLSFGCSMLSE